MQFYRLRRATMGGVHGVLGTAIISYYIIFPRRLMCQATAGLFWSAVM